MTENKGHYATPLVGQVLNLPDKSVAVHCPACGTFENSIFEKDDRPISTRKLQAIIKFCSCNAKRITPTATDIRDGNHFCRECGCYFGRVLRNKKRMTIQ